MIAITTSHGETALAALLRQSMRSGAPRRAVLLHVDRLPPELAKPHHLRLAREALSSLAAADRAQVFELPNACIAIVWRSRGGDELALARDALDHLLAGQPNGSAPAVSELLTLYDLPEQAEWLLDEIALPAPAPDAPVPSLRLDAAGLAGLEAALGHAELSGFMRWRPVMRLTGAAPTLAWEERYFAVHDIAAALCPQVAIKADPWLFRRLTRTLDQRMLALLQSPRELRGCGAFALNVHVSTILSANFLRFDEALPLALRGEVILCLRAADLLADPASFSFARRFAQARGYRLCLAAATLPLLRFLNLNEAAMDYVQIAYAPDLAESPGAARLLVSAATQIVVTGLDRVSVMDWACKHGFQYGRGTAFIL